MAQIEILHESETLQVKHLAGTEPTLVITFGSVSGGLGGVQIDEFVGTASGGGQNHVLFVRDKLRSWFSREDVLPPLLGLLNDFIAANDFRTVRTIGNSMGGYGALLLTKHLKVDVAVAFVPQLSMHPDVIRENRWQRHRENFGPLLERNVAECLVEETQYYAIFGQENRPDRKHLRLLQPSPGLRVYNVPGAGHDVAAKLKQAGLLSEMVGYFFARDTKSANRLVRGYRETMKAKEAAE